MGIWKNPKMESLLSSDKFILSSSVDRPIPRNLMSLLESGFRTEQDCILFNDYEYFGPGDLITARQKTEYEEFLNRVPMNFSMVASEDEYLSLALAIKFGHLLYNKLSQTYTNKFRVVILCDYNQSNEGVVEKMNCEVFFYQIRFETDTLYKEEYLSHIENEAIMFLE